MEKKIPVQFYVYRLVSCSTGHGSRPSEDKTLLKYIFQMSSVLHRKGCFHKRISINECIHFIILQKIYFPDIKNLSFHLKHLCIFGTHNCGKERHDVFPLQRLIWRSKMFGNYTDQSVESFKNKIQYNTMNTINMFLWVAL